VVLFFFIARCNISQKDYYLISRSLYGILRAEKQLYKNEISSDLMLSYPYLIIHLFSLQPGI